MGVRKTTIALCVTLAGYEVLGFAESDPKGEPTPSQRKVLQAADTLMNDYEISYVYGGNQLGKREHCEACNLCLEKNQPSSKKRLVTCPDCLNCSIDCSHFTHLALTQAGFAMPYLPTEQMLELSPEALARKFNLIDIGANERLAAAGDLLVYHGHVVILERNYFDGHGDIIHATSGQEIRLPGQGIQRKRRAPIVNFRGPLLRILRHRGLADFQALRPVH